MLLIPVVKLKQVLFHSFNRNIHHVQTCCWGLARKITSTQLGILHVVSFNSEQLVCTVVSYLILPCCALPKGCVVLGCLNPPRPYRPLPPCCIKVGELQWIAKRKKAPPLAGEAEVAACRRRGVESWEWVSKSQACLSFYSGNADERCLRQLNL